MDLKETYNTIAEEWHKDHQGDDWWKAGTDNFISLLPPKSKVLDVGCGSGVKSGYFLAKGFKVTGIDFAEKLIEIAKRENPTGEFRVMDMREAAKLGATYSAVFAQASLLHIPKADFADVLRTLIGLLSKNGLLYIAVKGMRDGKPEEEIKEEDDYGYSYQRFFSYYSMGELNQHFIDAGLQVIYQESSWSGKTEWLQIAGKKK